MQILKLKVMVEKTLQESVNTRNSDILLRHEIIRRWFKGYVRIIEGQEAILFKDEYHLPTQDNIKRIRAVFQNRRMMYPPTSWEVAKARGWNEKIWRGTLNYLEKGEETRQAIAADAEIEKRFKEQTGAQGKLFEIRGKYGGNFR